MSEHVRVRIDTSAPRPTFVDDPQGDYVVRYEPREPLTWSGPHDDCIATFPHHHDRPYQRGVRLACLILMGCNKGRNHDGPCHVPGGWR